MRRPWTFRPFFLAAVACPLVLACAANPVPETADPSVAEAVVRETAPDTAVRVIFDWTILEGEARFSGRGVARIQPPHHARLDLFGPRGDGYLSAALVGDEVRLPPGIEGGPLPPPAMMWSVLGVVAPPAGAILEGTLSDGGRTELHYAVDGSRLRYTLEQGRLSQVQWEGDGRRMVVRLNGAGADGVPREAHYRDVSGYTELMLNRESVNEEEPFPSDIWTPGA